MKGENEKKEQDTTKTYSYKKCHACGVKMHIDAIECWKCKEKAINLNYHSNNKEDEIYSRNLNSVERCMNCYNVLQRGNSCEQINCFGTGRGRSGMSCEYCRRTEGVRFNCCQEVQKDRPTKSLSEELKEIMRNRGDAPGPMAKTLASAFEQPQFDDEVPF